MNRIGQVCWCEAGGHHARLYELEHGVLVRRRTIDLPVDFCGPYALDVLCLDTMWLHVTSEINGSAAICCAVSSGES